jgi:very-short-patch-repair endonuclease
MPALATIYQTVRELRKSQTRAEEMLWKELKASGLKGYKFRRQHPIIYFNFGADYHYFIADFYCADKKLVVEVDGNIHNVEEVKEIDKGRQDLLEERGYKVIRFRNEEVLSNIFLVLNKIQLELNLR